MKQELNRIFFGVCLLMTGSGLCEAQSDLPADPAATKETVSLYHNLKRTAQKGFLFGHQDDLAYGVEWKYKEGRSDVLEAAGDYPAVYGWDLGGLERPGNDLNIDGVPFKKMKQFIRQGYERGGVITLSWHTESPLNNGKGAWDTAKGIVASINPGGSNHALYKEWLDKVAGFIGSLKGSKGEAIPVLFRPFHEHSGSWFWWGRNNCTVFEYQTLWRFTFYYLHTEKKLHNILWVYNTGGDFNNRDEYLERYPGDDKADILSFDTYQYGDPSKEKWFEENTSRRLRMVDSLATEKHKLLALAETGYEAVTFASWWTKTLMNAVGDAKICYLLIWRNHGYHKDMKKMHYYAPYKGQVSEEDFREFYKLERTLFEKDALNEKLYQ